MGKDWLYWAGGGSSGGGGGGGGGKSSSSSSSTKRAANNSLKEGLQRNTLSGCMSAVFHLFDFHQLHFCLHKHDLSTFDPHSFLTEEQPPNVLKGLEAPRNSLEMEKEEDGALNIIPMAIQIKTSSTTTTTNGSTNVRLSSFSSSSKARTDQDLSSSECSTSSPGGSKTPSLVARLMGLDLLPPPGSSSPSPSTQSNPLPSKSPHLQYLKQEFQNRQRINQLRSRNTRNGRYSVDSADVSGIRSLPDTPRTSSSSRRSVESRLSLQINKENVDLLEFSGTRSAGRRRDSTKHEPNDGGNSCRSPSHYARQIVKQVKERVGRKVGADITNRDREDVRGDNDRVVVLKSKKPSSSKQVLSRLVIAPDEDLQPSCSPRLKPLEVTVKNKSNQVTSTSFHSPRLPLSPLSVQVDAPPPHPPTPPKPRKPECSTNAPPEQKCKKIERYGARLKKKKQEEQFVRSSSPPGSRSILPDQKKKSKRTPLSSDLLINFPVKKEPSQSSSRKSPQNQQSQVSDTFPPSKRSARLLLSSSSYDDEVTLSSTSSSSSKVLSVLATHTHADRGGSDRNGRTPTGGGGEAGLQYSYYYNYIREILSCTGINVNAPVSLVINKCWYYSDPTRPLDPPIFNHLERTCPINTKTCSELRQRCNRRLIFDLTNEILSTMLRPTRRRRNPPMKGLIEVICTRISRFPAADCRVLEDIDALIGRDFCGVHGEDDDEKGEEELIVSELENELVDSLVQETALWMWVVLGGDKRV